MMQYPPPPEGQRVTPEEQELRVAAYKARIALALERYAEWKRKKGLKP